jgi:hypothetical protein
MFVDYRYPALIRGRAGSWQKDRHIIVSMVGRVEIEEIGSGDAPLAATVTMTKRVDFRLYDGKFYRAVHPHGDVEFRSGLDNHIASGIADACHTSVGKDILPWPRNAAEFIRHSDRRRDGFRHLSGEFLSIQGSEREQMVPLSSLATYEQADVEHWEKVAADYIEGLILIDGLMWLPVREPLMAGVTNDDQFLVRRFVDASIYDARFANPKDQPTPFGRRDGFTSTFWNPGLRVYPLNADDEVLDGKLATWMLPIELHIPEAFGQTYAMDELDRVARVVVSELYSVCKTEYGSLKEAPAKLREYITEMRRLLSSEVMSDDVADLVVRQLQLIRHFIIGSEIERSTLTHGHWKPGTLKALIKETIDMWANREINLDVSWMSPSMPIGSVS